jgi:hypothetical protein
MLGAGFAGLESYEDTFQHGPMAGDNTVDAVDSFTRARE